MCSFNLLVLVSTNRMAIGYIITNVLTTFTRQSQSGICDLDTPRDTSCLANWQGWKTFPVMAKWIKSSPLLGTTPHRWQLGQAAAAWPWRSSSIRDFRYLDKTKIESWDPFHCRHCTGQWQRVPSREMTQLGGINTQTKGTRWSMEQQH